jgi:hypothetical protein
MDRRSLLASLMSLPLWLVGLVAPSTASAERWKRLWTRERAISQATLAGQLVIHEQAMKNKQLADDATGLVHAAAGWMRFEANKSGFNNVPFVGLLTEMHEWLAMHDSTDERRSHQKYLAGEARRLLDSNWEERNRINERFSEMLKASDAYRQYNSHTGGYVPPSVCYNVVDALGVISDELGITRREGEMLAMFHCNVHADVISVGIRLGSKHNMERLGRIV